jgi:MarR family transcriptional regulator, organic hydroperoxide resistance regulator
MSSRTVRKMEPSQGDLAGRIALPEVLSFMQVLWRVVHGIERSSKEMASTRGITGPQRLVLRLVGLRPGVSAGAVAATLHVHPSTLTGVLRRLELQGMLRREPHAADRRRAVLRLTSKGQRLNDARHGTIEAKVQRALRSLTAHEQACARRALAAVADRVDS